MILSQNGSFQFISMEIWLYKAKCSFLREMHVTFPSVRWELVLAYPDENDIFESAEAHNKHERNVFELLCNVGVITGMQKFKFLSNPINSINYVIHLGQLAESQHTKNAICTLEQRAKIMEPRSFLVVGHVFQWFVYNFAKLEVLLTRKLWKDEPTHFEELLGGELLALWTLHSQLITKPVFSVPLSTDSYTFYNNVHNLKVGNVLSIQQSRGQNRMFG